MAYYGYHRVSTKQQNEDRGIIEIQRFCESRDIKLERDVYVDKQTGKNFERPRYIVLKEDVLRSGDILIIAELDRLGRNKQGILKELQYFKEKGVRVMILEVPTSTIDVDASSPMYSMIVETIQSLVVEIFAIFAESEILKKEKRQKEGIEAKKLRGEWDDYGRPHAVEWQTFVNVFEKVLNKELKPFAAVKELNISTQTYYRYKKKYEEQREMVGL